MQPLSHKHKSQFPSGATVFCFFFLVYIFFFYSKKLSDGTFSVYVEMTKNTLVFVVGCTLITVLLPRMKTGIPE